MRLSRARTTSRRGPRQRRAPGPARPALPPAGPVETDGDSSRGATPRYRVVRRDGAWVAELRLPGDGERKP